MRRAKSRIKISYVYQCNDFGYNGLLEQDKLEKISLLTLVALYVIDKGLANHIRTRVLMFLYSRTGHYHYR